MGKERDIYCRRPISTSRGRTHERIMALQHAPEALPGAEELLPAEAPDGSIAAAVRSFHRDWVAQRPVTGRRAYERLLVLLVKDLAANGPSLAEPLPALDQARLFAHLQWRLDNGMGHASELPRAAVGLARMIEHACGEEQTALRDQLRERVAMLLADPA
jgi:hypothetical protein